MKNFNLFYRCYLIFFNNSTILYYKNREMLQEFKFISINLYKDKIIYIMMYASSISRSAIS